MWRITVLMLLLWWTPLSALADLSDTAYGKAKNEYRMLIGSARKQQFRDKWEKVIKTFLAVPERYPDGHRAAEGLFMAGKAGRGLYDISRVRDDAERAAKIFDRLVRQYPRSVLADDALFEGARLRELALDDKAGAFARYQRIVDHFPKGDMFGKARSRAASLVVFAPPPQVTPPRPPLPATPVPAERPAPAVVAGGSVLTGVEFWSRPGYTRIVMNLDGAAEYQANVLRADSGKGLDPRIYIDLKQTAPAPNVSETTPVRDGLLRQIRVGRHDLATARVVVDLVSFRDYKTFTMSDPYRIVVDVFGADTPMLAAQPTEISALPPVDKTPPVKRPAVAPAPSVGKVAGLRRIVVDAGHGGKDPGAIGPSGLREKDITLAMAKVLKGQLEKELGCEVILTRKTDVYLSLEQRTALANKVGADLFISLHANASLKRSAYGVETYYLNFSKNDKAAAVAARENGTSLRQVGDLELILFDLMANAKINESSRLAAEIQKSLVGNLARSYSDIRDLGVKQGPFYVLVGATMPSVLVEAAFISHAREESRLASRKFQEQTGVAIVRGVRNYASDLKLMASK